MRGLVVCWVLIGGLGFFIFPWYVTGDGFFSINWILEYSLEDYGSVLPQVFINKKYWLGDSRSSKPIPTYAFIRLNQ